MVNQITDNYNNGSIFNETMKRRMEEKQQIAHSNYTQIQVKLLLKKLLAEDTKIYSIPSAVTGIRQLDTNGGITLTERFKQKFNRV